ncbi:YtxH domain-containing protein [Turicibacter sp. TJ11]|uniref:YtxH domain-containing protein n=1 Tax=Turicibacter sp. TJ11 TaxID=2806443 RepID=UPI001F20024B|nr:YtxH domain-containing protein [Turicibacter sp. TJ11]
MKKRYIFTLGALMGGAAALFLTPKNGKELQAELLEKVEELQEKVQSFDQQSFKETCKEQVEQLKETITNFEFSDSIQLVEEKVKAINERIANLKGMIDDHQEETLPSLALNDELEDAEMVETLQTLEDLEEVEALEN